MADAVITQKLEFDAAQALSAMKEVELQAQPTAGKAQLLAQKVADYSRSLGENWQKVLRQMREHGDEAGMKLTTPLGLDVTNPV